MIDEDELLKDYAEFETYIALGNHLDAAKILLHYVILYSTNKQRLEPYQLESISFFLKQITINWNYSLFSYHVKRLIELCDNTCLIDIRAHGQ